MAEVDPYAFSRGYYNHQNYLQGQRQERNQLAQQGVENERNRLRDMYLGEDRQRQQVLQGREDSQYADEQKIQQLRMMNAAAAEVSQNPQAITRWGPQLEQAGMLSNAWQQMSPEELQSGAKQLYDSTTAALQAYGGGSMGNSSSLPASIQEWHFMQGLPEGERGQFLNLKRQPTAPQVVDIGGVPHLVDRVAGTQRPLSSLGLESYNKAQIAGATSGAGQRAKDQESRANTYITDGLDASDAISITRRGLELLDEVRTGGVNAVALKASNLFGVTGADEGELSANLGKAVLAQLRATFGAQFTEREGARLQEIEAGFGKSTAANRRLLEQAEKILDRTARRGLEAAKAAGDNFAVQEIERNLKQFSLSPGAKSAGDQGGLTPEEQAELEQLRRRFGR